MLFVGSGEDANEDRAICATLVVLQMKFWYHPTEGFEKFHGINW
jgi:hypothetical protein